MFQKTLLDQKHDVTPETQTIYMLLVSDPESAIRNQYEKLLNTCKKENAILKQYGYLREDYMFALHFSMITLIKQYLIQFDVLINQTLFDEFDAAELMDLRNADLLQIVVSLYRQFALYKIRSEAQQVNEARADYFEDKSF